MFPFPSSLSPAQLEAHKLLAHLLATLKDPESTYYPRYGHWIVRHAALEEFLFRCVRPDVWKYLSSNRNFDSMKLIRGDLKFEGRAVYLDGILGTDKNVRVYVGQSNNLRFRVGQHLNFRYRRDNPSLHYHAMLYSIYNVFSILAILPPPNKENQSLPGMDCPDLLLNVLEMWMCLIFRTLPDETLEKWFPEHVKVETPGRAGMLNIATPIDQGGRAKEWPDLKMVDDPLVQEYLANERRRNHVGYARAEDMERIAAERKSEQPEEKKVPERKIPTQPAEIQPSYLDLNGFAISPATLVFMGISVVLGVALLRNGSRPHLRK
ncbi:hypothetical protein BS50DRAFT_481680 [Corynespora cassiicola Philippines]|uniref:Uncharacterized protein n=1 Tax=Corynespora cassiicola Philippines TaxID=1448308 RepID=A0A2T2P528_CORCC|nr:hypothetical protein BS50DRAFT_481680 [Corynespora cassiicola Philippines]